MLEILENIIRDAAGRLRYEVTTYLPPLLAAIALILGAYLCAVAVRWLVYRIFKGLAIDRFLRQSGIAFLVDPSGRLRATRLVAEGLHHLILLCGVLLGVNVFGTNLTTHIVQSFVFLLPKLAVAGLILLGGVWLSQYLGRSMLVWAVNENFPTPRRLAVVVRVLVVFTAVVVAADQLDFARSVFLAAFIIFVGGAVLAGSLMIGLGGGLRGLVGPKRTQQDDSPERPLWTHL